MKTTAITGGRAVRIIINKSLLILILFAALLTAPASNAEEIERLTVVEKMVLDAVNRERKAKGLSGLKFDRELADIAMKHSVDMLNRKYFSHTSPEGMGPGRRVARGSRTLVGLSGENIWRFYGSLPRESELARLMMVNWMQSKGHRENILRKKFTHIGVGIGVLGTDVRATQVFMEKAGRIDRRVPQKVERGDTLNLTASSGRRTLGDPNKVVLYAAGTQEEAAGPFPAQKVKLDVPPGNYRIGLMFEKISGNYRNYKIYLGPEFEIY